MTTQEILKNIREKHNLTQDQMAERIHVTRQAVSRWETGETQPNTEMLKVPSRDFYADKNTLLDFLLSHMPNPENMPEAERRKFFDSHLSQLKHWKQQA